MQKRKNLEPASTSATGAPKRACGLSSSARSSHSTIQNNDPVLSTLSSIQSSISNINSRIQALESGSASRISENLLSGPASSNTASTTVTVRLPGAEQQVDDIIPATIPRRTMGSAVPVSTGSTFFSPTAAISHQLRSQIIAGNDVNLVKKILGPELSDGRVVDCGDVSVMLKDNDPRLSKTLTLAEFIVAFGVFRDVICEVLPSRRAELDRYLAIIADISLTYGGTLFYEYHKSLSAKAAMFIQRFNQRLDWSVVDLTLISRHFTGHQALSCSICGSHTHTPNLCPKSMSLSNLLNLAQACNLILSYCGDGHSKSVCPRRTRFMKKEKKK